MNELDEILGEFIVESRDSIERLDEVLAVLPLESVNDVMRTLHTIRGTSGFFGLPNLEAVACRGEALLQRVLDGEAALDEMVRRDVAQTVSDLRALLAGMEIPA